MGHGVLSVSGSPRTLKGEIGRQGVMKMDASTVEKIYVLSRERYAEYGVSADAALAALEKISISLPCWQGDDVKGFEKQESRPNRGESWRRGITPAGPGRLMSFGRT